MIKLLLSGALTLGALIVPSIASAHTGRVTCDGTGVIFTYDANFPANTAVTEHVNGVNYSYVPAALVSNTHTDPLPGVATFVASATWVGGGTIAPVTLTCPVPTPPPPVEPPIVPPPAPPVVPPPVIPPKPPVVPPTPTPVCGKGYKLHQSNHVNYCLKTVVKIKKIVTIKYVWWCPLPPHKKPGVTG